MGLCGSIPTSDGGTDTVDRGEDLQSRKIEAALKAEREQKIDCIKLLLLGSGECGKSTILKQMKILHQGGFTTEERQHFSETIFKNTLQSIQTLITATKQFDMFHAMQPMSQEYANMLASQEKLFPGADVCQAIHWLWTGEDIIRKVFTRQSEYTLLDSAPYFLDNIQRILAPGYIPNDQDVLRSRMATTGIIESDFVVNAESGPPSRRDRKRSPSSSNPKRLETDSPPGPSAAASSSSSSIPKLRFKFVDVGGQRGERKKWIHCFEDVRSILFIASLNEFDQMLAEDRSKNRLLESLQLFEGIIHLPWFQHTSIILFLNKHDLFKQKIKTVDLGVYFPQYAGGHSYEDALVFMKELFFARNHNKHKVIYAHCQNSQHRTELRYRRYGHEWYALRLEGYETHRHAK